MKKGGIYGIIFLLFFSCHTFLKRSYLSFTEKEFKNYFIDERDANKYGIVEIGNQIWFAENLKFKSENSVCYKNKKQNCSQFGRLYASHELDDICPKGWRVPTIKDWVALKANFYEDSITALLDTVNWDAVNTHSNKSGLSIQGAGYQISHKYFLGYGQATSLWLNQVNKYDEFYHVHLYGGKGIKFERTGFVTNEVFHAHPIEDLKNRKFSVRCLCDKRLKDKDKL